MTCQTGHGPAWARFPVYVAAGDRNIVTVSKVHRAGNATRRELIAAPEILSNVLALALPSMRVLVVAAERGIIVFELPSHPNATLHSPG
jgi:hypothetical protein